MSADPRTRALGADRVGDLAKQAGLEPSAAAAQLSSLLPGLVDELTPDGAVPQGGALEQGSASGRSCSDRPIAAAGR